MTKTRNQPRTAAVAAPVRDEAPASTKTARLLAMLKTDDGASVQEISMMASSPPISGTRCRQS